MKKIISFYTLYILSFNIIAQNPCEPLFIDLGITGLSNTQFLSTVDKNYIIFGDSANRITGNPMTFIAKIDKMGNKIFTKLHSWTLPYKLIKVIKLSNGDYVSVISFLDKSNDIRFGNNLIIRFDQSGNIIWSKEIQKYIITDFIESKSGDLIFASYEDNYINQSTKSIQSTHLFSMTNSSISLVTKDIYVELIDSLVITFNRILFNGPIPLVIMESNRGNFYLGINYEEDKSISPPISHKSLIRCDANFNFISKLELERNTSGFPTKIIETSNGDIEYWINDEFHGFDATQALINSYRIDTSNTIINNKNYYFHGSEYKDGDLEHDSCYLLFHENGILKFNKKGQLLSSSSLNHNTKFSRKYFGVGYAEDSVDQYSFLCINKNLELVKFNYFGKDCIATLCGKTYYDADSNCQFDSSEKIFIGHSSSFDPFDNATQLKVDTLGNYIVNFEYGTSYLSIATLKNNYYLPTCRGIVDTINFTYPNSKLIRDYGYKKIEGCLPISLSQSVNFGIPGKYNKVLVSVSNPNDSIQINTLVKIKPEKYFHNLKCSHNFKINNDTICVLIDTLFPFSYKTIELLDSVECSGNVNDSSKYLFLVEFTDNCTNQKIIINISAYNIYTGFIKDSLQLGIQNNFTSSNRPCSRIFREFIISNNMYSTYNNFSLTYKPDPLVTNIYTFPKSIDSFGLLKINIDSINGQEIKYIYIIDSISCDAKINYRYCQNFYANNQQVCSNKYVQYTYPYCSIIRNSRDPNNIEARTNQNLTCYPKNDTNPEIIYTINFQNTGNDTAFKVQIIDTLNNRNYFLNTITPLNSSHPYSYQLQSDSILEFTFNKINLLPKVKSDKLSQGFVNFRVRIRNSLSPIPNRAGIFFDANPILNTDYNFLDECRFTTETISLQNNSATQFFIYPNPTNTTIHLFNAELLEKNTCASIYNSQGRKILTINSANLNNNISIENFSSGIYYLLFRYENQNIALRFVVF